MKMCFWVAAKSLDDWVAARQPPSLPVLRSMRMDTPDVSYHEVLVDGDPTQEPAWGQAVSVAVRNKLIAVYATI
jgi:hypothetical protein